VTRGAISKTNAEMIVVEMIAATVIVMTVVGAEATGIVPATEIVGIATTAAVAAVRATIATVAAVHATIVIAGAAVGTITATTNDGTTVATTVVEMTAMNADGMTATMIGMTTRGAVMTGTAAGTRAGGQIIKRNAGEQIGHKGSL